MPRFKDDSIGAWPSTDICGCHGSMAVMFTSAQTPLVPRGSIPTMRFIHLFLAGYFVVILGIGLGLWQAGVFNRVSPNWIGIGALVAVGVGMMLAVASGKPTATEPAARQGGG